MASVQVGEASQNSIGVSPGLTSFAHSKDLGLRASRVVASATHTAAKGAPARALPLPCALGSPREETEPLAGRPHRYSIMPERVQFPALIPLC